jgi:hypothetical protein
MEATIDHFLTFSLTSAPEVPDVSHVPLPTIIDVRYETNSESVPPPTIVDVREEGKTQTVTEGKKASVGNKLKSKLSSMFRRRKKDQPKPSAQTEQRV